MIIKGLIKDVISICESYLSKDEQIYYSNEWNKFKKDKLCEIAAIYGWIDLLDWAHNLNKNGNMNKVKDNRYYWTIEACTNAIKNGNLNVLIWAKNHGCHKWNKYICYIAAEYGHLDILKWAYCQTKGQDKDKDKDKYKNKFLYNENVCSMYAVVEGHLEILKFIKEIGVDNEQNKFIYSYASQYNHSHILKYMYEADSGTNIDNWSCYYAHIKGNKHILEWLKDHGCKCNGSYHKEN